MCQWLLLYNVRMRNKTKNVHKVLDTVFSYYQKNKRSFLWRENINPYRVLVSEYMLQQTQTDRVVPKYESFIERFPDVHSLAEAGRSDVLEQWVGLGYNRRAKALHNAARMIVNEYRGIVPDTREELLMLPGVGDYTAGAVMAFAYDKDVVLVETNIRTVILHHCITRGTDIGDSEVKVVVGDMQARAQQRGVGSRIFYTALMDYGAYLKQKGIAVNARSKHYTKQKAFAGSVRQARGEVLRMFVKHGDGISLEEVKKLPVERLKEAIGGLVADGTIEERQKRYYLIE